jgi:uncharacterized membrane protein YeiH
MNDIMWLEYLGLFAFAASGAFVAIEEEFDLFGIYLLATITAIGGGVLRDMVTDVGIPVFFSNYKAIPFILLGATVPILLKGRLKHKTLFVTIDAIGLSAFFVSAGLKAIEQDYSLMLFLFAASITGVGGGVLRDIITNRKPEIFKHDIYCVAGILGSLVLWYTYPVVGMHIGRFVAIGVIILIRMVSYFYNIQLPVVKKNK